MCTIICNNILFLVLLKHPAAVCVFFQATRSVSLFPVVSLMCNTLSCSQVEQPMIAGNDEFGFTHISDPLHLSLLGSSKRIEYLAM